MKDWEIIAEKSQESGLELRLHLAIDSHGRTIWIAEAHRDDGKRFIAQADEKLRAFIELERQVLTVTFISNPSGMVDLR